MKISINFCDFWPGFEKNNMFLRFLNKYYSVSVDKNPDYLFYSVYGNDHLKYDNCIKILYTGENLVPDFNLCDYALGFHFLDFEDRYMRFPLYVYYQWYYEEYYNKADSINSIKNITKDLQKRKFCNFIYSNNINSDPMRDLFFHELSNYKKVDSGGKHLNNIGQPVEDKMEFIKDYKFTIAFENSSVPGYTTEKLLEPILMKSLPIYYGNPLVHKDFNIDPLIIVKDVNDFKSAIDEIIYLDQNDDAYLHKLNQSIFPPENNPENWERKLLAFMRNIFEQPISSAGRSPVYGFNRFHKEELVFQHELMKRERKRSQLKYRTKTLIGKYLPSLKQNR